MASPFRAALIPLPTFRLRGVLSGLIIALGLFGCTSAREPYSRDDARGAEIPGFANVRTPLDGEVGLFAKKRVPRTPSPLRHKYLAISGGGAGGAFSVGALKAWSQRGDRPTFDVVSGVSTGALIAPFAFLGPDYDDTLEHLYTSGVAEDLLQRRPIISGLLGESLYYQKPLMNMVEQHVTQEVLDRIAVEYRKGRDLFVLTTNLDTQRGMLWDMGAIAASSRPDALNLFRNVLVASASIPGAFPAVKIIATIDGRTISELHSDGAPSSQIVTVPEAMLSDTNVSLPAVIRGADMYFLINNTLMPEFSVTSNSTVPVVTRAYASLVKSQTRQSLYAAYEYCRRTGVNFHMAVIDAPVPYNFSQPFGNVYMRAVFKIGYDRMEQGRIWRQKPIFTPGVP